MPIGPYPDFDACVADNQDMDDPEAFCAWLEKEVTGQSEKAEDLSPTKIKAYEKIAKKAGFVRKNGKLVKQADLAELKTTTVEGVEIFAIGTWNGDEYTDEDLKDMVSAFKALSGRVDPPLKVGHTSDKFNIELAKKLGVPEGFITGEDGEGAIALGWVSKLYIEDDIVKGDFSDVPVAISDLIKAKSFNQVSAEVRIGFEDEGKTYPIVLTAVALLGAELPAVRETAPLEVASVFTYTEKPTRTVLFGINLEEEDNDIKKTLEAAEGAVEAAIKGKSGAGTIRTLWKEIKSKLKGMGKKLTEVEERLRYIRGDLGLEEDASVDDCIVALEILKQGGTEVMKEVNEKLGLAEDADEAAVVAAIELLQQGGEVELKDIAVALELDEGASKEDILAALTKLKGEPGPEPKEYKSLTDENRTLKERVGKLEKEGRYAYYKEHATKLSLISGTPDEIAQKLVDTEMRDKGAAEDMLKTYQDTQIALEAAGAGKIKGSPAEGDGDDDKHEFLKLVDTRMSEKHVDEPTAFAQMKDEEPEKYKNYMANRPIVFAESPAKERQE